MLTPVHFIVVTVKDIYYFRAPHDNFWTNSQENMSFAYATIGKKSREVPKPQHLVTQLTLQITGATFAAKKD